MNVRGNCLTRTIGGPCKILANPVRPCVREAWALRLTWPSSMWLPTTPAPEGPGNQAPLWTPIAADKGFVGMGLKNGKLFGSLGSKVLR